MDRHRGGIQLFAASCDRIFVTESCLVFVSACMSASQYFVYIGMVPMRGLLATHVHWLCFEYWLILQSFRTEQTDLHVTQANIK